MANKSIKLNNMYWDSTSITHNKKKLANVLNDYEKIGKLLWTGSFSDGSITVPGLSNYTIIGVYTGNYVMCIGTKLYGSGGFLEYGSSTNILFNAYRFNINGDTITLDDQNKGATNGTSLIPVKAIYGII